jgi:hypothetical protein
MFFLEYKEIRKIRILITPVCQQGQGSELRQPDGLGRILVDGRGDAPYGNASNSQLSSLAIA